jgi:hypothetical protein
VYLFMKWKQLLFQDPSPKVKKVNLWLAGITILSIVAAASGLIPIEASALVTVLCLAVSAGVFIFYAVKAGGSSNDE